MKSLVLISLLLITGCADFYIGRDFLRQRAATIANEALDSALRVERDCFHCGTVEIIPIEE